MGAPAFKYRQLFQERGIVQFSGSFELYGDISKRITALLATITPRIEIYSVDESFLDVSELPIADYAEWGRIVRDTVYKNIGVPVSIGIATSKTLAKLASEIAKQHDEYQGAFSFIGLDPSKKAAILAQMPVEEIWGVGRKLAPRLRAEGAGTALALSEMRPQHAQQLMGIHGRQMVAELNGTSCYGLTPEHAVAKSILRSRTFGEDTNQAHVLEAAIANLSARAAFHLRSQKLTTRRIGLFTETNRHKPGYRSWTREIVLDMPTNDTGTIIGKLVEVLGPFYTNKQEYHRFGVFLHDFNPEDGLQTDLLGYVDPAADDRSKSRMEALDAINTKWGKGKIHYASEGLSKVWQPRRNIRSPRYVSDWNELPEAHIV
jgi:DNA polymerase V